MSLCPRAGVFLCLLATLAACGSGNPAPEQPPPSSPPDGGTDSHPAVEPSVFPLRAGPVAAENALAGSSGWKITSTSETLGAFTDPVSARPGETVSVRAADAAATTASWELWRLGAYGGAGGRRWLAGGPVPIAKARVAKLDPVTGATSAEWPVAFSFQVPEQAVTGVYVIKLTTPRGETYALLVVREQTPAATSLVLIPTNTYQAYNAWGGTSLYTNRRADWQPRHAYAVSYDRPYEAGRGTGEVLWNDREPLGYFESQGVDLAYATDVDLDADPGLAERRRLVVFQGHSEYWTAGMRAATEAAIGRGTNVAFFGANNGYWQVRFAPPSPPSTEGRRLLIGYKDYAALDPLLTVEPARATTRWRDAPVSRPENAVTGAMFGAWVWTAAPLLVAQPSSWIWTGTGVQEGTILAGVYGDETDARFDNGREPAGLQTVGEAQVESRGGKLAQAQTTLYTAPSGAQVFSASSIEWSRALVGRGRWDRRIQQVVGNLFSRLGGSGELGPAILRTAALPPGAPAPVLRPGAEVRTVTRALPSPAAVAAAPNGDALVVDGNRVLRVAADGQVSVVAGAADAGFIDGEGAAARFFGPRGIAVGQGGTIYVSDTGNNRVRRIQGTRVTTLAGGEQGFADGPGASARFSQPMGIAVVPGETVLVADAWNHRLRAVEASGGTAGSVSTWARLGFPVSVAALPGGAAAVIEAGGGALWRVAGEGPLPRAVSVLAGEAHREGWADGPAADASVAEICGLAARPNGELFFLDTASLRIRTLAGGVVSTVAGGSRSGTVDGPGATAGFSSLRAVAIAPDGSLLVLDAAEHALRRVTWP